MKCGKHKHNNSGRSYKYISNCYTKNREYLLFSGAPGTFRKLAIY